MRRDIFESTLTLDPTHWWLAGKRRLCIAELQRCGASATGRCLDVGTGGGHWGKELQAKWNSRIVVTDTMLEAVAAGKAHGFPGVVAHAEKLPFRANSFQLVSLLDVLEHIQDDTGALKEMRRILQPEGYILIHVPAHPWLFTYWDRLAGHARRYTKSGLFSVMSEARFCGIRVTYAHFFLFFVAAPIRLIQEWSRRAGSDQDASPDYTVPPRPVVTLFNFLYGLEASLRRIADLPCGLSIIGVGQKKLSVDS